MNKLYIYLDESGQFRTDPNQPSLIAGIAYLARDDEDPNEHWGQLQTNMEETAGKWKLRYPNEFHSTNNNELKKNIRSGFSSVTSDLFANKRYTPIVMICYPNEIEEERRWYEANADGLYRHMLIQLLEQTVGSTAFKDVDSFCVYIPTREAPIPPNQEAQIERIGMRPHALSHENQKMVEINANGIHLTTQDELKKKTSANVELTIESIDYRNNKTDYQCGYRMADMFNCYCMGICREDLEGVTVKTDSHVPLVKTAEKLRDVFHTEPIVFSYGAYYEQYISALESAAGKDPTQYLLTLVEFSKPENKHLSHYASLLKDRNPFGNDQCIAAMDDYLFINYYINARYQEVKPLYEKLIQLAEEANVPKTTVLARVKLKLMCCWQHMGEVNKARALFDECWNLNLPAVFRLDMLNKYIQCLLDVLRFRDAKGLIDWSMENFSERRLPETSWIRCNYPMDQELEQILNKCKSTRGQISAYLQEYEEAFTWFQGATEGFLGLERGADYCITLTHLLHAAIAAGDFDRFGKYAAEFFGYKGELHEQTTWEKWYRILLDQYDDQINRIPPDKSIKFSFFVFYKALYCYTIRQKAGQEAWLCGIGDMIFANGTGIFDMFDRLDSLHHPFELIYKYVALLAILCGNQDIARESWEHLVQVREKNKSTVRLIAQIGLCQIAKEKHQNDELTTMSKELENLLLELCDLWGNITETEEENDGIDVILARFKDKDTSFSELLTYEYT